MLKWIACYLSGRHDYQVACEPGVIFLKCRYCERRSTGWELHGSRPTDARVPVTSGPHHHAARGR